MRIMQLHRVTWRISHKQHPRNIVTCGLALCEKHGSTKRLGLFSSQQKTDSLFFKHCTIDWANSIIFFKCYIFSHAKIALRMKVLLRYPSHLLKNMDYIKVHKCDKRGSSGKEHCISFCLL